jgi:hypothetical protein
VIVAERSNQSPFTSSSAGVLVEWFLKWTDDFEDRTGVSMTREYLKVVLGGHGWKERMEYGSVWAEKGYGMDMDMGMGIW